MKWISDFIAAVLDSAIHVLKEFLDALNSKGGGIFVALLIFYSSFFMWQASHLDELKQVVVFSAGTLVGLAGGDRLANGKGKNPPATPPPSDPPTA